MLPKETDPERRQRKVSSRRRLALAKEHPVLEPSDNCSHTVSITGGTRVRPCHRSPAPLPPGRPPTLLTHRTRNPTTRSPPPRWNVLAQGMHHWRRQTHTDSEDQNIIRDGQAVTEP